MKVIIEIMTKKPEGVKVYLREILNQISKNRHFFIVDYKMETTEDK